MLSFLPSLAPCKSWGDIAAGMDSDSVTGSADLIRLMVSGLVPESVRTMFLEF